MKKSLSKYFFCFYTGIRNDVEYRLNIIITLLFNFLPVFVNFFLWNAVYLSKGVKSSQLSGMTLNHVISYIIIVQIIDLLISTANVDYKVMTEIKNGEICKYILKPVNYLLYNLSLSISQMVIYVIPLLLIAIFVIPVFEEYIIIANNGFLLLSFIVSIVIAYLIKYLLSYTLGLIAFFLDEVSHIYHMFEIIIKFLAGFMFPLVFLPDNLKMISDVLPFQYVAYYPAMILLGKFDAGQIIKGNMISLLWIAFLCLICRIIWNKGMKRYSAFGG